MILALNSFLFVLCFHCYQGFTEFYNAIMKNCSRLLTNNYFYLKASLPSQATFGSPLKFVSHSHTGLLPTSLQIAFSTHVTIEHAGAAIKKKATITKMKI